MRVKLVVFTGKQKGREIPLPETIFLIGRDRQCHLRPHCQGVSNLHCAIAAWAGKVRLRDLRSRNGTFLNGRAIHGEVAVADGDRLQVGTLDFAIRIETEEGTLRAAPIEDEREVAWLLGTPADSAVLDPAAQTCVLPSIPDLGEGSPSESGATEKTHAAAAEASATTPGSKVVSAGQRLRAYFETKR